MNAMELTRCSAKDLNDMFVESARNDNYKAMEIIRSVQTFFGKVVKVVKGRKVPVGTVGKVFWIGSTNYSRYPDRWGIFTKIRVGIKDDDGGVFWTSVDNVEVLKEESR